MVLKLDMAALHGPSLTQRQQTAPCEQWQAYRLLSVSLGCGWKSGAWLRQHPHIPRSVHHAFGLCGLMLMDAS